MVNRIWQYHFGRGIVSTPNDFGRMGTRPSHPELLDWLANQFVEGGWKMKPIHRHDPDDQRLPPEQPIADREAAAVAKDPENALLWKFNRRRLEAEEIRDSMLAVSGRLNEKSGGPSVLVPIDRELVLMLKRPQSLGDDARQVRARPPHSLPDLQAQSAAAVHGSLRRAGHAALVRAARAIDARSAGSGAAERQNVKRSGASLRRAAAERKADQRRSGSITRCGSPPGACRR